MECKKVYICYHSENVFSQILKEDCEEVFSKYGIDIIESKPINDPHLDLEELIKNISSNSQVRVLLVLSSIVTIPVALALARANSNLGSRKLQLIFSTAMSESLTFYKGANAIENVALITPDIPEDSMYVREAKSRWEQSKLDWRVACSHDAAQALIKVLRMPGKPTRRAILENLRGLRLGIDQTSDCEPEFSTDNSNIFMKYRIDLISP